MAVNDVFAKYSYTLTLYTRGYTSRCVHPPLATSPQSLSDGVMEWTPTKVVLALIHGFRDF